MTSITRLAAVSTVLLLASCGGSKSPTEPGSASRAVINVTAMTVTGTRISTGFSYAIRLTVQNTGGATATMNSAIFTIGAGGQSFGQVTLTDLFSNASVGAGATMDARPITLTD